MKIIYYYQTFCGLENIINDPNTKVTHIHLSSVHFGLDSNDKPYIHLNDNIFTDKKFDTLWEDLKKLKKKGIKIILMVGGAGGAYNNLFKNYDIYKKLLFTTILNNIPLFNGIDLDIEEEVSLNNVKLLINDIRSQFGPEFIISMTPIQQSLMTNEPGMGGFIYKDLYNSIEGKEINYFNVQCYDSLTYQNYKQILDNHYPLNMINLGMISNMDLNNVLSEIKKIRKDYNLAGVYNWEYFNSPPDGTKNPETWSILIANSTNNFNILNISFMKINTNLVKNIYNFFRNFF